MNRLITGTTRLLSFGGLLLVAGFLASITTSAPRPESGKSLSPEVLCQSETLRDNDRDDREKYLFVWAGDQARINPDFLAVINFDQSSRDYGRVITTVPLPGP